MSPRLILFAGATLLAVTATFVFLALCRPSQPALSQGGQPPVAAPNPAGPPEGTVDPETAGRIHGVVSFAGTPPPKQRIHISLTVESVPESALADNSVLVRDGRLQDTFIHIAAGEPVVGRRWPLPSAAAVLETKGWTYIPRVLGLRAGQTLEVVNRDSVMHSPHFQPSKSDLH